MEEIASTEELPEDGTFVFRIRDGGDEPCQDGDIKEAILAVTDGEVQGWVNSCQHWTDVRLDSGDGAETRNGEIVCEKHGAYFEMDTGYCNYGPCEGSRLPGVDVEVRDGEVYLADESLEFIGTGPTQREGEKETPQGTRGGDDFEL